MINKQRKKLFVKSGNGNKTGTEKEKIEWENITINRLPVK